MLRFRAAALSATRQVGPRFERQAAFTAARAFATAPPTKGGENPVAKRKAAEKKLEADLAQLQKEFLVAKEKYQNAPPAKAKATKTGLQLFGESGKLAHALLDAAVTSKADVRRVNKDLHRFQGYLDQEAALQQSQPKVIPATPEGIEKLAAEQLEKAKTIAPTLTGTVKAGPVSPANKIKYLQETFFPLLQKEGAPLDKLVQGFICMMLETKKFDKLYKKVCANFDELVLDHLKEVRGTVTSTEPLDRATLSKIEAKLKQQLEPGQTLVLSTNVDPSILGGLVVTVGSKAQDLSARYAIKRVEQALRSTGSD